MLWYNNTVTQSGLHYRFTFCLIYNVFIFRGNVTERLNSLIQATHVGKRSNSSYSDVNDWVEIIRKWGLCCYL